MRITTTLTHNHNGTPKIVAKGAGKQRTVNYDHAVSHESNHAEAVAALVRGLVDPAHTETLPSSIVARIDSGEATHSTENGAKHVWNI